MAVGFRGRESAPLILVALDTLARELGGTAATVAQWREQFLAGGQAALKSRPADDRDDEMGNSR